MQSAGMRAVFFSFISAMILGLAGGYAWSVWTAPGPHHAKPPKAAFAPIPESPEELPAEQDKEWQARAGDKETPASKEQSPAAPVGKSSPASST